MMLPPPGSSLSSRALLELDDELAASVSDLSVGNLLLPLPPSLVRVTQPYDPPCISAAVYAQLRCVYESLNPDSRPPLSLEADFQPPRTSLSSTGFVISPLLLFAKTATKLQLVLDSFTRETNASEHHQFPRIDGKCAAKHLKTLTTTSDEYEPALLSLFVSALQLSSSDVKFRSNPLLWIFFEKLMNVCSQRRLYEFGWMEGMERTEIELHATSISHGWRAAINLCGQMGSVNQAKIVKSNLEKVDVRGWMGLNDNRQQFDQNSLEEGFSLPKFLLRLEEMFSVPSRKSMTSLITTSLTTPLLSSLFQLNDSNSSLGVKPLRERVISHVEEALKGKRDYAGTTLTAYGSSANGLCTGVSDIDISIIIPALERERERERERARVVHAGDGDERTKNSNAAGRHFRRSHMADPFFPKQKKAVYKLTRVLEIYGKGSYFKNVIPVAFARVPVIKTTSTRVKNPFSDDGTLNCDICFNNEIAVTNSGLLLAYASLSKRLRELMLLVKCWVKKVGIGNAADGTPSSYCWMICCIYFGQRIGLVPNLQEPAESSSEVVDGLNVYYRKDAVPLQNQPEFEHNDSPSPIALLQAFLLYFGRHHDRNTVIRIHADNKMNDKNEVVKSLRVRKRLAEPNLNISGVCREPAFFCVEDPFETFDSPKPHDLMQVMSAEGIRRVNGRLAEAIKIIEGSEEGGGVAFWTSLLINEKNDKKQTSVKKGTKTERENSRPKGKHPVASPNQKKVKDVEIEKKKPKKPAAVTQPRRTRKGKGDNNEEKAETSKKPAETSNKKPPLQKKSAKISNRQPQSQSRGIGKKVGHGKIQREINKTDGNQKKVSRKNLRSGNNLKEQTRPTENDFDNDKSAADLASK